VTRVLAELPPGTHPMTQLSIAVLALQVLGEPPCKNVPIQLGRNKHPSYRSSVVCLVVGRRQRTSFGMYRHLRLVSRHAICACWEHPQPRAAHT
jgi:hypothetical protein